MIEATPLNAAIVLAVTTGWMLALAAILIGLAECVGRLTDRLR